jgi:hypothetical protein
MFRRVAAQFLACSSESVTGTALLPLLASPTRLGAPGLSEDHRINGRTPLGGLGKHQHFSRLRSVLPVHFGVSSDHHLHPLHDRSLSLYSSSVSTLD